MPSEHEDRVIRRFGLAVVVTFGILTALPFAVASSTGRHPVPSADAGGQIVKSAQASARAAASARRD